MKGIHNSLAWLYKRYITEAKSMAEMAKEAGVTERTIRNALERKKVIQK